MKIPLTDPRVSAAIADLKKQHQEFDSIKFATIFEEVYHCKIVADPEDAFCLSGWMTIPEGKYKSWFALKYGAGNE